MTNKKIAKSSNNKIACIFEDISLTREPRKLENSDFDKTLYTCRGEGK